MAISIHGQYDNPKKSPWNFEKFQSDLERRMMDRLERDPHVVRWMKRHGNDSEKKEMWAGLLQRYCELDTLSMVLILEHWRRCVGLA